MGALGWLTAAGASDAAGLTGSGDDSLDMWAEPSQALTEPGWTSTMSGVGDFEGTKIGDTGAASCELEALISAVSMRGSRRLRRPKRPERFRPTDRDADLGVQPKGRTGKRLGGRGISSTSESPFSEREGDEEREELEEEDRGNKPYRPLERTVVIDLTVVRAGVDAGDGVSL